MNFFNKIVLFILISAALMSCTNIKVKNLNNDKRIVTFKFANGNIKKVFEKYYPQEGQWIEVECLSKLKTFEECKDIDLVYTQLAILKINQSKNSSTRNKNISSLSKKESSDNKEESSNNEEKSSSSEEESSNNEEDSSNNKEENQEPFDPAPPPGECGHEIC